MNTKYANQCRLIFFVLPFILIISCKQPVKDKKLDCGTNSISQQNTSKFNINLFIENSESMDGYVNLSSKFEESIIDILHNFYNFHLANSISLNYINKNIAVFTKNANDDSINHFLYHLTKKEFQSRRHPPVESEFYEMFDNIFKQNNPNTVTIFISDCIYYPTKVKKNYCVDTSLLEIQRSGITRVFSKVNQGDFSAIILQMTSDFIGDYFDRCNRPIKNLGGIKGCERPYYIWIMGSNENIQKITNSKMLENIPSGNLQNICCLQSINKSFDSNPNYDIMPPAEYGNYSFKGGSTKVIYDANTSKRDNGNFEFTVELDLPQNIYNDAFYCDINNYSISGGNFQLVKIEQQSSDSKCHKFLLKFHTNRLVDCTVNIDLIANKLPTWVIDKSTYDDKNIEIDSNEIKKTFGIKYIIRGITQSFNDNKPLLSIKIPINLKHSHLNGWFILLILIIISGVLIKIIKK